MRTHTRCLDHECRSEDCSEHWPYKFAERRGPHQLYWQEDRWHVDGFGIHAGDALELRISDGAGGFQWISVRIESADSGRILIAFFDALTSRAVAFGPNGAMFPAGVLDRFIARTRISPERDRLRLAGDRAMRVHVEVGERPHVGWFATDLNVAEIRAASFAFGQYARDPKADPIHREIFRMLARMFDEAIEREENRPR